MNNILWWMVFNFLETLTKLRPMLLASKRSTYILDDKQLWSFYHAYIVSHVWYLNPVRNCASRERCRPFFVLINKTIKAIYDHPTFDLYGGEILTFDRLCIFQDMLLIFKFRNGLIKHIFVLTLLVDVHHHYTINRGRGDFYFYTSRTNLGRHSILPDGLIR
jgi:hypothetical protein